jgi:hypothetical protein
MSVAWPILQLEKFTVALTVPFGHPQGSFKGVGLDVFSVATPEETVPVAFNVTVCAPHDAWLLNAIVSVPLTVLSG